MVGEQIRSKRRNRFQGSSAYRGERTDEGFVNTGEAGFDHQRTTRLDRIETQVRPIENAGIAIAPYSKEDGEASTWSDNARQ